MKWYNLFGITNRLSKTCNLSLVIRFSTLYSSHRQGILCPMKLQNAYDSWVVIKTINHVAIIVNLCCPKSYRGCPRRNGQNFGRVFLMLNYTDITQNTYIQSWKVTEIMAIEKCGLLGCPRAVSRPWRHTHPLRMHGNEKPLANIGMQWPWRDKGQLRPA